LNWHTSTIHSLDEDGHTDTINDAADEENHPHNQVVDQGKIRQEHRPEPGQGGGDERFIGEWLNG
jgi:hypothetical protein